MVLLPAHLKANTWIPDQLETHDSQGFLVKGHHQFGASVFFLGGGNRLVLLLVSL